MNRLIKISSVLILIVLLVFTINSCKKSATSENSDYETIKARTMKATLERYGPVSARMIVPINERAHSIWYTNEAGDKIMVPARSPMDAGCGLYTCGSARIRSDLYETFTIENIKWVYNCTNGNSLTASWLVSVPYNLLLQHPNTSAYSFGEIRITNGGTTLTSSGTLGNGNLAIASLGTDPGCSSNNYYRVTYTWTGVADSYFPGNKVEAQFTVYNNCAITSYNISASWTQGSPHAGSSVDVFSYPCDRVDMPFTNPNTGFNNCTTVVGEFGGTCSLPSGWTSPTDHQVEYRPIVNTSSDRWADQGSSSTVYNGVISGSGNPGTSTPTVSTAGVIDLRNMLPSTGKWVVRYRNVHSTDCPTVSGLNSTWSGVWHEEVWNL